MQLLALKIIKEDCNLIFTVLEKVGNKLNRTWRFYVSIDDWVGGNGENSFFDSDDTLRTYNTSPNLLRFKFCFFESQKKYYFEVSVNKVYDFIYGEDDNKECIIIPAHRHIITTKLENHSIYKLKQVIADKTLRRKFGRAVGRLMDCSHTVVKLFDDFADYSFYFVKFNEDYKPDYNGGLIFHRDVASRENLARGHYGIHT